MSREFIWKCRVRPIMRTIMSQKFIDRLDERTTSECVTEAAACCAHPEGVHPYGTATHTYLDYHFQQHTVQSQ
jgi:hypothetical protein